MTLMGSLRGHRSKDPEHTEREAQHTCSRLLEGPRISHLRCRPAKVFPFRVSASRESMARCREICCTELAYITYMWPLMIEIDSVVPNLGDVGGDAPFNSWSSNAVKLSAPLLVGVPGPS